MKVTKKIALATAAALAFAGISTSANAAPLAVTVAGVVNATTPAAPRTVAVPATNVIDAGHSVAIAATADTGSTVSFVASSTIKLTAFLNTVSAPVVVGSGSSTVTSVSAGSAITLYAYTTSTAVGYVTVTSGSYSTIVYISGTAGPVYNVSVSAPTSLATGSVANVVFSTTDVFGNPVGGQTVWATMVNGSFTDSTVVKPVTTSAVSDATVIPALVLGSVSDKIISSNTGNVILTASIPVVPTPIVGFAAPVRTAVANITATDLNATIASLNAQIAALTKTVADNKVAADAALAKAITDAKTASDAALAKALADAKTASDAALADAKTASDKALADVNAKSTLEYNALVLKYNKLVLAYIAKAKKYKFSANIAPVATK